MPPPVRVLVVDDSVVVRRLVTDALEADPDFEVVGTAANGPIALSKLTLVHPDVVTLDIEMPGMDGIETLAAIRERRPDLPVVMFSTLTERGAAITLEALSRGASDYVTKPANVGSVQAAIAAVRAELGPKLKALCGRDMPSTVAPRPAPARVAAHVVADRPAPRVPAIIAVAASTGGPSALSDLLSALPPGLPVPVVVVQHMPAMFTALLADRLSRHTGHDVREAAGGECLEPGTVWIAPGGHHLEVAGAAVGGRLALSDAPPENSCRPSADVLFRSVAEVFGGAALAVVLTGMGRDGLAGVEPLFARGVRVLVQDAPSSVVWGMPGAVAQAGLADRVLPLSGLAPAVQQALGAPAAAGTGAGR